MKSMKSMKIIPSTPVAEGDLGLFRMWRGALARYSSRPTTLNHDARKRRLGKRLRWLRRWFEVGFPASDFDGTRYAQGTRVYEMRDRPSLGQFVIKEKDIAAFEVYGALRRALRARLSYLRTVGTLTLGTP